MDSRQDEPLFESMDASTDSLNLGRRMYPPTLIFGSVHASTDSKIESADASINSLFGSVDASTDSKIESEDASTDPISRVLGCLHRL